MEDTPEHVKRKQLEIWLAKPEEERLRLTLQMNDELNAFWTEGRKSMAENRSPGNTEKPENKKAPEST